MAVSVHSLTLPSTSSSSSTSFLWQAISLEVDRHTQWKNWETLKEPPPRSWKTEPSQSRTSEQARPVRRSGSPPLTPSQLWTVILNDSVWMAVSFCWPNDFYWYLHQLVPFIPMFFLLDSSLWAVVVPLSPRQTRFIFDLLDVWLLEGQRSDASIFVPVWGKEVITGEIVKIVVWIFFMGRDDNIHGWYFDKWW